jgi:hypothetical protein
MDDKCKVMVNPGVCGLKTTIVAEMDPETMKVKFTVESDCAGIRKMAASLGDVDVYSEMGVGFTNSAVYKAANDSLGHLACPVPCAFVKAMEAAGGLGLKKNVSFEIV